MPQDTIRVNFFSVKPNRETRNDYFENAQFLCHQVLPVSIALNSTCFLINGALTQPVTSCVDVEHAEINMFVKTQTDFKVKDAADVVVPGR